MIDKEIDLQIRNELKQISNEAINNEINKICIELGEELSEFLYYMLIIIEEGFYGPDISKHKLGEGIRKTIEWFIKEILKRNISFKISKYSNAKKNRYEKYILKIMELFANYAISQQIEDTKGIDKIKIEEVDNNKYELLHPEIVDQIDKQKIYYEENGGLVDKITKISVSEYILNKYGFKDILGDYKGIKHIYDMLDTLDENIDEKLYELCKQCIACDVDKIGINFSSSIIDSSEELIDVLGFLFYISHIRLWKCGINPILGKEIESDFVIYYKKDKLVNLMVNATGFSENKIIKYIDYLIFTKDNGGRINEYPLFYNGEHIIFIPSSIILNDFQFSIVNGHYDKGIEIADRKNTVSQSIVNKIYDKCKQYKNIVVVEGKKYFERKIKYRDKDLKSDIDLAIYDNISNRALIIECKWQDKVFFKSMNYRKATKEIDTVYMWQLGRHKTFIELEEKNLDYIFDYNQLVVSRPYFPLVSYIMVDKRIQYHFEGKHAISEFILLHLIDEYSNGEVLRLDLLIDDINSMQTKINYKRNEYLNEVVLSDGKIVYNNIFTIL